MGIARKWCSTCVTFVTASVVLANAAVANPVYPSAGSRGASGTYADVVESHETRLPQDVLAYPGDPAHCLTPPFGVAHCYPPDSLVQAYFITTTYKIYLKRKWVRPPNSPGNQSLQWKVLSPRAARDVPVNSDRWAVQNGQVKRISNGVWALYALAWNDGLPDYQPNLAPFAQGWARPSTKYNPGDPDFFLSVANMKNTAPNTDVCLGWYKGPEAKACSQAGGGSDSERGATAAASELSHQLRGGSVAGGAASKAHAHKPGAAKPGANTSKPRPEFHEFAGHFDQGSGCCMKYLLLKMCNEEMFESLPTDASGSQDANMPDCEWTHVTGITDVPTCTGTGLSGGIEYKSIYLHTESKASGSAAAGRWFDGLISVLKIPSSTPGGVWAQILFASAQKATRAVMQSLGDGRDTVIEMIPVESQFTPGLSPPVTWPLTEHTTLPGCPPIIMPQVDLPLPEGTK